VERLIAYVDGFNLYFGLREAGWQRFLWLDIEQLFQSLLKSGQTLVRVNYFTARVSGTPSDPDKPHRQNTYLEALQAHTGVVIRCGHYLEKERTCLRCSNRWADHEEKGTDVNIAVQMLLDAFRDELDTALLISADSDLAGPVEAIQVEWPRKRVVVAFPPNRYSVQLEKRANASFHISRAKISGSQLPDPVVKADGYRLHRPLTWK
jgi:uncharacterized LabA/DUF88 family protein